MVINVLEWLETAAEKCPSKTAFADADKEIMYAELQRQAKNIGCHIVNLAEQRGETWRNQPIAVLIDRNIESLILFMGIFYIVIKCNLEIVMYSFFIKFV